MKISLPLFAVAALGAFALAASAQPATPPASSPQLPYQNPALPINARVDDLLGRMTMPEKLDQMTHEAKSVPRLGVPEYNWWNEGLHGVPRQIAPNQPLQVSVRLQNNSARGGDEVVELYLRPAPNTKTREISPGQPMPRLVLSGFSRVPLAAHKARVVSFTLRPEQLRLVNARGERVVQPGEWQLYVGGRQPHLTAPDAPTEIVSARVLVK